MSSTLIRSTLAAIALALAGGSAHASLVSFEDPTDSPFLFDGDSFTQNSASPYGGYAFSPFNVAGDGGFVGAIGDSSACATVQCPVNNASNYYSAVNDGVLHLRRSTRQAFRLNSFLASFLGASGEALPGVSGLLHIEGGRADGTYTTAQFLLGGPDGNGQLNFAAFDVADAFGYLSDSTGTLLTGEFVDMFFYGYTCNSAGDCNAFTTNRGQFALDDIDIFDVPEPASGLLVALSLGAAGLVTRRRAAKPIAA